MLKSFFSPCYKGRVVLREDVLRQIGIGKDAIMYGAVCSSERTLILSFIPLEYWDKAYKIIIHTSKATGSLYKAAAAIAQQKLNTISSWASTESFEGHLSYTSIVISEKILTEDDLVNLTGVISKNMEEFISELKIYDENHLKSVRITPLSLLANYKKVIGSENHHKVSIHNHNLELNDDKNDTNLWTKLISISENKNFTSCIITPDTEEAFLRISTVDPNLRLCTLSFNISIKSSKDSFPGYWEEILDIIKRNDYCIFRAHNLMLEKKEHPDHFEKAEFQFVMHQTTQNESKGIAELTEIWGERLKAEIEQKFAIIRGDKAKIDRIKISRPRGVGINCFFSTNAKPGNGKDAQVAIKLCEIMIQEGFKPLNMDRANNNEGLREQIRHLVEACHIMVVLHCEDDKRKIEDGKYAISEWVAFEEGLMDAHIRYSSPQNGPFKGDIIRLRFDKVIEPNHSRGLMTPIKIPSETEDYENIYEVFRSKLKRFLELMNYEAAEHILTQNISSEHLNRDLISYYKGLI